MAKSALKKLVSKLNGKSSGKKLKFFKQEKGQTNISQQ